MIIYYEKIYISLYIKKPIIHTEDLSVETPVTTVALQTWQMGPQMLSSEDRGFPRPLASVLVKCVRHTLDICVTKITVYQVVLFNFMFPCEWNDTSCPGNSVWVELFQQVVTPALPSLKSPVQEEQNLRTYQESRYRSQESSEMCGHNTESILEVNRTGSGILNDTWRVLVVSPNCSFFSITFCILLSSLFLLKQFTQWCECRILSSLGKKKEGIFYIK